MCSYFWPLQWTHDVDYVFVNVIHFNTLSSRQDEHHFSDKIFQCIFLNEDLWISFDISLNFAPKGQINNVPVLVQIMLEPTRRQAIIWTNDGTFTDAYLHHSASMS